MSATPMGQQSTESAAGSELMPGMPMLPQTGRTGPQLPMPMAGNSRSHPNAGAGAAPQTEELPLPMAMGPGGPTAPSNVQPQGMLDTRTPKRVPMQSEDIFGSGEAGGGGNGFVDGESGGVPDGSGQGQMGPAVMMRLMRMLGRT